ATGLVADGAGVLVVLGRLAEADQRRGARLFGRVVQRRARARALRDRLAALGRFLAGLVDLGLGSAATDGGRQRLRRRIAQRDVERVAVAALHHVAREVAHVDLVGAGGEGLLHLRVGAGRAAVVVGDLLARGVGDRQRAVDRILHLRLLERHAVGAVLR